MKVVVVYAWCFSHGTLHRFQPGVEPWCTASWVHLDAYSEEVALAVKRRSWGDARFLHELTPGQQITIIGLAEGRRSDDGGPTVQEAAAADRVWDLEKAGE